MPAMRPGKVPRQFRRVHCSTVADELLQSYRNAALGAEIRHPFNQFWPIRGIVWTISAKFSRMLTDFDQLGRVWPKSGQHRANAVGIGQVLAKLDKFWSNFDQCWVNIGQTVARPELVQDMAHARLGRVWAKAQLPEQLIGGILEYLRMVSTLAPGGPDD